MENRSQVYKTVERAADFNLLTDVHVNTVSADFDLMVALRGEKRLNNVRIQRATTAVLSVQ